jgi:hypothetical protein
MHFIIFLITNKVCLYTVTNPEILFSTTTLSPFQTTTTTTSTSTRTFTPPISITSSTTTTSTSTRSNIFTTTTTATTTSSTRITTKNPFDNTDDVVYCLSGTKSLFNLNYFNFFYILTFFYFLVKFI